MWLRLMSGPDVDTGLLSGQRMVVFNCFPFGISERREELEILERLRVAELRRQSLLYRTHILEPLVIS